MSASHDTIFALSSAPGKAAVAVVRISGPQAHLIADTLAGPRPPSRQAALRTLRDPATDVPIDTALVLLFDAPASATGEDVCEFHIHGGRAIQQTLQEILGSFKRTRPAEPGEFTRRSFDNGKIDLTTAEGIADLIDADTEAQRQQAHRQASGHLATLYDGWRSDILQAQALVEAAIDFSDEADVFDTAVRQARVVIERTRQAISDHLQGARRGEIIRTGFRVVIMGPPNAGKSSLLNTLARRDAAIVSHEPGTTRDVVEVSLDLDGLSVIMSDTAGIRETSGLVEQEGIRRAHERARDANLVIWLESILDVQFPSIELTGMSAPVIRVWNKSDLKHDPATPVRTDPQVQHVISLKDGRGIEFLISDIVAAARDQLGDRDELVPSRHRHAEQLRRASLHLAAFVAVPDAETELAAEELRLAATAIGRLTGRIDVEDVLDQIFSRFCIGK